MKLSFACVLAWLLGGVLPVFSQTQPSVVYELSMPHPQTHYFEVGMSIANVNQVKTFSQGYIDVKMPVWTPGSYLIREYAKNVEGFVAQTQFGEVKSEKISKNTWRVYVGKQTKVLLKYRVYAYELSVRTSFLDESHGYLNGASVFMYLNDLKDLPAKLQITPYPSWKVVSTGLPKSNTGEFSYEVPNYDILVDSPIEIGNHRVLSFEAAGIPHYLAMYGEATFDEKKVIEDVKKVVITVNSVVGTNPCQNYVFIVHHLKNGGGGLEHLNSTTLQINRNVYQNPTLYKSFLSLVAHEYFHLWNVKRIRPIALGPFDYENENYTHLLWVAEGFTTFYQSYLLRRANILSPDQYLNAFVKEIEDLENTPGQRVQSLAESSWDAWIKHYRQNENSRNSTISYYSKGAVIGGLLNMQIIAESKGEKSLDDVMRYLWNNYYIKQNRGITDAEMQQAVETVIGKKMDTFFNDYIWGTKPIDYQMFFKPFGLNITSKTNSTEAYLGADVRVLEGKLLISGILKDSPAYQEGLNVNDEIIAVDDEKISPNVVNFKNLIANKTPSSTLSFTIIRDGLQKKIAVTLIQNPHLTFSVEKNASATSSEEKLLKKWLYSLD